MSHPQPPQQPYGPPPVQPTPKKGRTGKVIGFGCLGVVGVFVLIAVAAAAVSGGDDETPAKTASSAGSGAEAEKDEGAAEAKKSELETFTACVAENGTAGEKAAAEHVTKVTGTDKQNNVLDAAEVFTDFTGGIVGPDAGQAKLIASAFASCYESENGLVSVYGADGELIANGSF